jgi:MoxR-like ATPase
MVEGIGARVVQDIARINEQVREQSRFVAQVRAEVGKVIVGQDYLISRLLIALLCDGHVLIEGVPGLAKTLSVKTLADVLQLSFVRVQFTPDLLPADLIGTRIYNQATGEFGTAVGPIFANVVLADEVNRAPAKVQSALLEAMQERQCSIGGQTFPLPQPFMVLATQNPIEQEGTYPLPEAQLDRFLMKAVVSYPNRLEERVILERGIAGEVAQVQRVVTPEMLVAARQAVRIVHLEDPLKDYILQIVRATRDPAQFKMAPLASLIAFGASPRASIYMAQTAQAHAFLDGRGYVTPEDVKAVAHDVLRHRVILTYEAEAEELTPDEIIGRVLDGIDVP